MRFTVTSSINQIEPMLEVKNKTPFSAIITPSLDKHGHNYVVVIIKGAFDIHQRGAALVISDAQQPPQMSDVFYGEPGKSSVKYEADIAPIKKSPDIVLNGYAYAPSGRQVATVDASLQIGCYKKVVRVFGDRFWQKNNLQWQATQPRKFERMQLIYEKAYGGGVRAKDDQSFLEYCAYNPVGEGFVGQKGDGMREGLALPNLEDPAHLIQFWDDRPNPVGFGFIGRSWAPRLAYAGTYDEQWQRERMPLLPLNFEERYYNGAHPDLILSEPLSGGEEVVATNLSESGLLSFTLPKYRLTATALIKGKAITIAAIMDTVVVEPDDLRVWIIWRAIIPCARQFLYIDNVALDWRTM